MNESQKFLAFAGLQVGAATAALALAALAGAAAYRLLLPAAGDDWAAAAGLAAFAPGPYVAALAWDWAARKAKEW